jgi:hypothetical protein
VTPSAPRRRCLSTISATDLLSTNTLRTLNSRALGFHLSAPRNLFLVCPPATAHIDEKRPRRRRVRCCQHSRPRVAAPFGEVPLAVTAFIVLHRRPGFPSPIRVGLFNRHEFNETATNTPCRTFGSLGLTRVRFRTRTRSAGRPPRQLAFQVQSVFRR